MSVSFFCKNVQFSTSKFFNACEKSLVNFVKRYIFKSFSKEFLEVFSRDFRKPFRSSFIWRCRYVINTNVNLKIKRAVTFSLEWNRTMRFEIIISALDAYRNRLERKVAFNFCLFFFFRKVQWFSSRK